MAITQQEDVNRKHFHVQAWENSVSWLWAIILGFSLYFYFGLGFLIGLALFWFRFGNTKAIFFFFYLFFSDKGKFLYIFFSSCMLLSWVHLNPFTLFQVKETHAEINLWMKQQARLLKKSSMYIVYITRSKVNTTPARWSVLRRALLVHTGLELHKCSYIDPSVKGFCYPGSMSDQEDFLRAPCRLDPPDRKSVV